MPYRVERLFRPAAGRPGDGGDLYGACTARGTLPGGSALADNDVWAYNGSSVDHYDGTTWTATSVASLLPGFSTGLLVGGGQDVTPDLSQTNSVVLQYS
jgi:hypothetical protein